jgi:hypothetical protein
MLVGLVKQLRPAVGEMLVDNETVPEKPFTGSTMMVDTAPALGVVVKIVGLANI